ncbi:mariner transposase [Trichonephila clavipes]|uniref:Mariner transposase n=1 Tax=Trichonephila clavipes TaxID=2585209 RepID=A0A8X6RZ42_TRICX|nr:mariner transposase [Trichonephila clavipes]
MENNGLISVFRTLLYRQQQLRGATGERERKPYKERPKLKRQLAKAVASVFWDTQAILVIDYLEKGKTIHSEYYMVFLDQLNEKIKKKCTQMQKKKVLFHQGNAPCDKSMKMMVKLDELLFELLSHPPKGPDLAPNDYWLFADLKRMLQGKKFGIFCQMKK